MGVSNRYKLEQFIIYSRADLHNSYPERYRIGQFNNTVDIQSMGQTNLHSDSWPNNYQSNTELEERSAGWYRLRDSNYLPLCEIGFIWNLYGYSYLFLL